MTPEEIAITIGEEAYRQIESLKSENKRLKDGNEWLMEEMQRQLDFQVSDKNHIEKLESENKELRKVLKELVELKDMKDRGFPATHKGAEEFAVYMVRKREAWDAARNLIKLKK